MIRVASTLAVSMTSLASTLPAHTLETLSMNPTTAAFNVDPLPMNTSTLLLLISTDFNPDYPQAEWLLL
jgi:hypothetical protein